MIKKFSLMMMLAITLVFVGIQGSQVEAAEVHVGNYSDGSRVYLLTNTIVIRSYSPYSFNCRVRAGYDYLDYYFYPYNGSPYYRNSEGYAGYVFGGASPVAANIYRYVLNNY